MSSRIYSKELADIVKSYTMIPKKIKSSKDIIRYRKYVSIEQSPEPFKIEEIIELEDDIYYQVKFLLSGRQAVIPYEDKFSYYEIYNDKSHITELSNIINLDTPYYGSEIRYWFFINKIDLDSPKYYNFKSILIDSKHMIADNKLYYLFASYLPLVDKYVDCRAVLYK